MDAEGSGGRPFRDRILDEARSSSSNMNATPPAMRTSPAASSEVDWRPARGSSPCDQRMRRMTAAAAAADRSIGGASSGRITSRFPNDPDDLNNTKIRRSNRLLKSGKAINPPRYYPSALQQTQIANPSSSLYTMANVRIEGTVPNHLSPGNASSSAANQSNGGEKLSQPAYKPKSVARKFGDPDLTPSERGSEPKEPSPPRPITPLLPPRIDIPVPTTSRAVPTSASAARPPQPTKILDPSTGKPSTYAGGMHSHFHREEGHEGASYGTSWRPYEGKARRCMDCGQEGHETRSCPRSRRSCYNCGQEGHIRPHCPYLRGNQDNRSGNPNHNNPSYRQYRHQSQQQSNQNSNNASYSNNNSNRNEVKGKGKRPRSPRSFPASPAKPNQGATSPSQRPNRSNGTRDRPNFSVKSLTRQFGRLTPEPLTPPPKIRKIAEINRNRGGQVGGRVNAGPSNPNQGRSQQASQGGQTSQGGQSGPNEAQIGRPPIPPRTSSIAPAASGISTSTAQSSTARPSAPAATQAQNAEQGQRVSLGQAGQAGQTRQPQNAAVRPPIQNSSARRTINEAVSGSTHAGPSTLPREAALQAGVPAVTAAPRARLPQMQQQEQQGSRVMPTNQNPPDRRSVVDPMVVDSNEERDNVYKEAVAADHRRQPSNTGGAAMGIMHNPALDDPVGFEQAERKAFILAKCRQFSPPMLEDELLQCPDYRAAISRNYPPTISFWNGLHTKLLNWREAQRREAQVTATINRMNQRAARARQEDNSATPARAPVANPGPSAVGSLGATAARPHAPEPANVRTSAYRHTTGPQVHIFHPLFTRGNMNLKMREALKTLIKTSEKLDNVGMISNRLYLIMCNLARHTQANMSDVLHLIIELPLDDPLRFFFYGSGETLKCARCEFDFPYQELVVHCQTTHDIIPQQTRVGRCFQRARPACFADFSAEKQALWNKLDPLE